MRAQGVDECIVSVHHYYDCDDAEDAGGDDVSVSLSVCLSVSLSVCLSVRVRARGV